jgi:hypothetical protein
MSPSYEWSAETRNTKVVIERAYWREIMPLPFFSKPKPRPDPRSGLKADTVPADRKVEQLFTQIRSARSDEGERAAWNALARYFSRQARNNDDAA